MKLKNKVLYILGAVIILVIAGMFWTKPVNAANLDGVEIKVNTSIPSGSYVRRGETIQFAISITNNNKHSYSLNALTTNMPEGTEYVGNSIYLSFNPAECTADFAEGILSFGISHKIVPNETIYIKFSVKVTGREGQQIRYADNNLTGGFIVYLSYADDITLSESEQVANASTMEEIKAILGKKLIEGTVVDPKVFTIKEKYVGDINSELKTMQLAKNNKNASYVSGQIVVVEWVDGKSTVPRVKPTMKFKSTDGKVNMDVFVTPTGTNTYYFDRFIDGIDTSKQYYFEITSGDGNNISEHKSMNVYFSGTKYNNQSLGLYNGYKLMLSNQTMKFTANTYVGNINSELKTFKMAKNTKGANYVSGEIVVVEWVNGKSTVPSVAPKMKFKSTDGKISMDVFVTPTGTNTYYFDRFIEGIDTSKQYYFEIASGDNRNVSTSKSMNVYFSGTKYNNQSLGLYNGYKLELSNQMMKFTANTYVGNINSELKSFKINKNTSGVSYVSGEVVVVEWVDGKSTVPKVAPKMKFKSTDGTVSMDVFVTATGTNTYYFDRFIEGIDTSKQYYFEITSGDSTNVSEHKSMNVIFQNSFANKVIGKYKDKNVLLKDTKILFQ